MRSPADMDIVQIDITTRCHLKCSNCTRLIAHQPKREDMSLTDFSRAVGSMRGWDGPGKVLGIIGGEPTLHEHFEQLALTFAEIWGGPRRHRRAPIVDLNAEAQARLNDRTSGRGLWTSLGAGFYRNLEVILEVFDHWNTNTHEAGGQHQALLITRGDYQRATGMSDDEWLRNRDKCWVQNLWSATINDKGAYPCEVMASIDRLYFNGKHAWPVEDGWWQRRPEDFGKMLDLCNYCALAQPGPSQVDALDTDIISPESLALLEAARSPAVRKEQFQLYDINLSGMKRTVETKDNYVAGDRVSQEHSSCWPRNITAVVVCVGRGEHLERTLPALLAAVHDVVVVTDQDDVKTRSVLQDLRRDLGDAAVRLTMVLSDSWKARDFAFNKGAMINAGLASIPNPDWILLVDCDVIVNDRTERLKRVVLNPGVLYGVDRVHIEVPPGRIPAYGPDTEPNGHFQLFNRRAYAIRHRWPRVMSEEFCSAGGVDSWFLQQFPPSKHFMIDNLPAEHIWHADGWNGTQGGQRWRQVGGVCLEYGFVPLEGWSPQPGRHTYRLVDTLYGYVSTCELSGEERFPPGIVDIREGKIFYLGRDIGHHHVHVSCLT